MTEKRESAWILKFIGIPLLFAVLSAGVFAVLLSPIVRPYLSLANYLFVAAPKAQPAELFSGLSEDLAKNGMIPFSEITYPIKGDRYGQLSIEGTPVNAPLYYGDGNRELNRGAGTYMDNSGVGIPGEGKTVLIAGHCSTFFNGLQDVKVDDLVKIDTHYGQYVYRVHSIIIADYRDETAYDFTRTDENLILYTCYPFTALGFVTERYFVYGEYVSGPIMDKER